MIVGWSENYGSETKFSVPENATKQKGHSNFKGLKKMEMRGIDPRTSRMLSERSTI
jgi:hypothetical protein